MALGTLVEGLPAWLAALLTLLPVVAGLELVLLVRARTRGPTWRESLLSAAVAWGVLVTLTTELLGGFHQLTTAGLATSWLAVDVALGLICWSRARRWRPSVRTFTRSDGPTLAVVAGLALMACLVGVTALAAPPNNWDGLSYHMSRVVHWAEDRSLANYPTNFLPQLYLGPWPELAILQSVLLSGSDRLSNFYGWASFVGCGLGASLIARRLGASATGQLLTAVVAMTAPMAIMQASNVQDDIGTAFWLTVFAAALLGMVEDEGVGRGKPLALLEAGAALGLAVLTKPTAYIYAAPFLGWLALQVPRRRLLTVAILLGVPVLLINAGHYRRNLEVFDAPLGPAGPEPGYRHLNDVFTPATLISNLVRNTALHLGTPIQEVNRFEETAIRSGLLTLGINPDDPATTWPEATFSVPRLVGDEDRDGNPVQLALILVALGIGVRQARGNTLAYAAATATGFVLFCFLLRWQPWHSRLHLPLFILWAPFVGAVLGRRLSAGCSLALAGTLVVAAMPWVVYTQSRPLVGPRSVLVLGRLDQYFQNAPWVRDPYVGAVDTLAARGCGRIGLISGPGDLEYPLWPLLDARLGTSVRIEHVEVENQSAHVPMPLGSTFRPCGLLVLANRTEQDRSHLEVDGQVYTTVLTSPSVDVLLPQRER